jgi:hypothetical protein
MPSQLCGIDILAVELIVIGAWFACGVWLALRAARHEEKPLPSWRWGDKPRRPKSFESMILEHAGGVAVFLSICVFGLRSLGLG